MSWFAHASIIMMGFPHDIVGEGQRCILNTLWEIFPDKGCCQSQCADTNNLIHSIADGTDVVYLGGAAFDPRHDTATSRIAYILVGRSRWAPLPGRMPIDVGGQRTFIPYSWDYCRKEDEAGETKNFYGTPLTEEKLQRWAAV